MSIFKNQTLINCKGKLLNLHKPIVMGILNVTPDSFYDGGMHLTKESIKNQVAKMVVDGATIIDVGAYSSRPGAIHITEKEELNRLSPALEIIQTNFPEVIVSVDTFRATIADNVVKNFEVSIINDISAGEMDKNMFNTILKHNVPYVIMHMQGTPQNMQANPTYADLITDIIDYFSGKINFLQSNGLHDIIIDPGFGFGKTLEHNYQLLNKMDQLRLFELPILAGVSRKSMIYKLLECTPNDSLNGTTVLNTLALTKGASILRVHDVKEAKETIDLFLKMNAEA